MVCVASHRFFICKLQPATNMVHIHIIQCGFTVVLQIEFLSSLKGDFISPKVPAEVFHIE